MESISVELEAKRPECLEHAELKSCDRCLLRCSRVFWSTTNNEKIKTQRPIQKDGKGVGKVDDQEPGTSYFLTAGQLLETGPSGKHVFKLSQQISKAPSLAPKRRHHVLNQSWRAMQLIETELENLRTQLLPMILQNINTRQEGILHGTSEEYKNAVATISEKYRNRRAEVNANCFSQMEQLRRQLRADLEIEEKVAKERTTEALSRRLKDVEDRLIQIGCTGPEFTFPPANMEIHQSNLYRIELDNKFGTSIIPLPKGLVESVREAEKEELQNFLLYGRMGNHLDSNDQFETKKFKLEQVSVGINGLIEDLGGDDSDENE